MQETFQEGIAPNITLLIKHLRGDSTAKDFEEYDAAITRMREEFKQNGRQKQSQGGKMGSVHGKRIGGRNGSAENKRKAGEAGSK